MIGYIALVFVPILLEKWSAGPPPNGQGARPPPSPEKQFKPFASYVKEGVRVGDVHPAGIPAACLRLWRDIAELDLRPFSRDATWEPRSGTVVALDVIDPDGLVGSITRLIASHQCRRLPDRPELEVIAEHGRELMVQCRTADDLASVKGAGPAFEGCVRELLWYRFYAVEYLTRDVPLDRIDDVGVLVHRLMARGSHVDPIVAPRIAAIAERILELDPNNADAARAALQFRYVGFRARRADADAAVRFETALARAETLEGDPPSTLLREMRINQARLRKDVGRVRELAMQEHDQFPESALGAFYLAWAAYLESDFDRAADLVKESEAREPTSIQAYAASKKIQDGEFKGADIGIFQEDAGDFGFAVRLHTRGRPVEFRGGYAIIPSLNQDLAALLRALRGSGDR